MDIPLADIFVHDTYFGLTAGGRAFMLACLTMFGAAIGSFMNVVVYRLPRSMSLSRPGSRCPNCEHPIRWHDNVPVLGWLMLGGKCRDCGAQISARYPLVEFFVALVALWLAVGVVEVFAGPKYPGPGEQYYDFDLPVFGYQLLLVCTLVCAALIEWDGLQPPVRLFVVSLAMQLVMLLIWPRLLTASILWQCDGLLAALATAPIALVLGAAAWPAWRMGPRECRRAATSAALGGLLLVGTGMGDVALCYLGATSLLLFVAARLVALKWPSVGRFGWAAWLALGTLAWLSAVRYSDLPNLVHPGANWQGVLASASAMFFLANLLRLAASKPRQPSG